MGDSANLFPSSPFDALPGGGFSGGEGAGGVIPSLPAPTPSVGFDPSSVMPTAGPVGGYTYDMLRGFDPTLPAVPFQGASLPGPVGTAPSAPAPYIPPGGGTMAPPDVTVASAGGPGTTAGALVTAGAPYSPGGIDMDEYGRVAQGGGQGAPAIPTATGGAPTPDNFDPGPGTTLTPEGARAAAQRAVDAAGGPVKMQPSTGASWLAENILGPFKQSGIGEALGLGIPAVGLISQLLKMQGGQMPLDPLQQQRLSLAQQQANIAQDYMKGQVPQGTQMNIQANTQAAIQQIKAKYAQLGMSGSTAEMQDIANAEAMGARSLADAQTKMIAAGASMMGVPQQQLQSLTSEQLAQDAAFNDALAKFVAAISGGPQTKTA